MKRSEINKIILDALDFADEMGFKLPPFARWTPEEWAKVADNEEYDDGILPILAAEIIIRSVC